eukprot:15364452-Ditylum_brightwellii.AAC.1
MSTTEDCPAHNPYNPYTDNTDDNNSTLFEQVFEDNDNIDGYKEHNDNIDEHEEHRSDTNETDEPIQDEDHRSVTTTSRDEDHRKETLDAETDNFWEEANDSNNEDPDLIQHGDDSGSSDNEGSDDEESIQDEELDAGSIEIEDREVWTPNVATSSTERVYKLHPRPHKKAVITGGVTRSKRKQHKVQQFDDHEVMLFHYATTQYSVNAGLKKFKEKGAEEVTEELSQLHEKGTFQPVIMELLTETEMDEALKSIMFLKEKRDNRIKGRMCTDGHKQQNKLNRKDATSPTVMVKSVSSNH